MPPSIARLLAATALLAAATLGCSGAARAWSAGGHMMVAQIAYERLNPRARDEVDKLLAVPIEPAAAWNQARDFVNAAHWADDVKRAPGFEPTAALHFIDYPFSRDGSPLPADEPSPENVVKALADDVAILRGDADETEKAKALRFVIHFAGDIHQPLHCATRVTQAHPDGDHGGNDFYLITRNPQSGEKQKTKLHAYWDGGLDTFPKWGANFSAPPLDAVKPAAAKLVAAYPAADPAWTTGGPFAYEAWAQESSVLAQTFAYAGLTENQEPSAAYRTQALRTAEKRVAWAGYRLAELLNAVYPVP